MATAPFSVEGGPAVPDRWVNPQGWGPQPNQPSAQPPGSTPPSQWGAPPPPRPRPDRPWYRREQIVTPLAILALVYLLGLVGLVARPPTPGGLLLGGATADR